jgi:nitric oxide reductase large subunit
VLFPISTVAIAVIYMAALFGVYGMLGIGLMLFSLRAL